MYLSKTKKAVIALIIANIIWGAAFPIYKLSLTEIPPFTFAFLRFFPAAYILLPFVYKDLHVDRQDIPKLIILSLSGISFAIVTLMLGLTLTASINAPIIGSTGPILLILFAIFFLNEKPKPKVWTGTIISLLGVILIILRPLFEHPLDGAILGNLLILLSTIGSVIETVLLKKILPKYNPFAMTFWTFLIGSVPLLPFVMFELHSSTIHAILNTQSFLGLGYALMFATVVAHNLSNFAIKQISASESGVFTYLDPVSTAIVAIPLLGETITSTYLIGSMLVFVGIFIAENRLHWHPLHLLRKS